MYELCTTGKQKVECAIFGNMRNMKNEACKCMRYLQKPEETRKEIIIMSSSCQSSSKGQLVILHMLLGGQPVSSPLLHTHA